MTPFFTHWPALAGRLQNAAEWLLIFDYDGSLAVKAVHSSRRRLPDAIRRRLRRLARRDKCAVAVTSGRSLSNLRQLVGIQHIIYIGKHGREIESNGWGFDHPETHQPGRQIHWNMGSAVQWLRRVMPQRTLIFYLGRGPADEDGFRALSRSDITLRVGRKKDSAAGYYVQVQSDVARVLDKLIAVVKQEAL